MLQEIERILIRNTCPQKNEFSTAYIPGKECSKLLSIHKTRIYVTESNAPGESLTIRLFPTFKYS